MSEARRVRVCMYWLTCGRVSCDHTASCHRKKGEAATTGPCTFPGCSCEQIDLSGHCLIESHDGDHLCTRREKHEGQHRCGEGVSWE
jgi:hypothetical protein